MKLTPPRTPSAVTSLADRAVSSLVRLRPLHPGAPVLEVGPRRHELLGGLPALRRRGFLRLQERVSHVRFLLDHEEDVSGAETFAFFILPLCFAPFILPLRNSR